MTVGGELYLRQTLVQTIKGNESGLWLTPSTVDIPVRSQESMEKRLDYRAKIGRNGVGAGCLSEQVEWSQSGPPIGYMTRDKFPTPLASDWKPRGPNSKQQGLAEVVKMWPTPVTRDWKDSGTKESLTRAFNKRDSPGLALTIGALDGGYLNPNWVEWLMNWPITWSNLNAIDAKKYQRWKETSTKTLQKSEQLSEMWWDNDPSQASFGQQPNEQSEQQHCNAVPQMPRNTTRQREMEGSYKGSNLPLLCNDIYLSESEAENVQSGMREQISVDETKIVPRTDKNIVARVDRLKAIGNGQVPLCAATAWELLK
jgi:hypothetical protein